MTRIAVRIGAVSMPPGGRLDLADLQQRVEAELAELLTLAPPRTLPRPGTTVAAPGGPLRTASLASTSAVAHAIARRVHDGLQGPEALP